VNGWRKSGWGSRVKISTTLEAQESAVLKGLVEEVLQMLAGRVAETPHDELAALTGMRTGPSAKPDDRVLARLLPDFSADDDGLSSGMRSLHEPDLIEAKQEAATFVIGSLPEGGGKVELTPQQADTWLRALNDVRLALGTALDVSEDMPEDLPADDPRAGHMGVYHWLTFVQDALVQARMQVK
jgi:hypothetical protein